jgi:hypothetical protein
VDEYDTVGGPWAGLQLREPIQMIGFELFPRPFDRSARDGIEINGVHHAGNGFVMIAANGGGAHGPYACGYLIRIRAIADHVAQANANIPASFSSFEDGFESSGVGVDITDDENAGSGHRLSTDEYKGSCVTMRVQGLEIGTKFRGNAVPKTDNWDTTEVFSITTTAIIIGRLQCCEAKNNSREMHRIGH